MMYSKRFSDAILLGDRGLSIHSDTLNHRFSLTLGLGEHLNGTVNLRSSLCIIAYSRLRAERFRKWRTHLIISQLHEYLPVILFNILGILFLRFGHFVHRIHYRMLPVLTTEDEVTLYWTEKRRMSARVRNVQSTVFEKNLTSRVR